MGPRDKPEDDNSGFDCASPTVSFDLGGADIWRHPPWPDIWSAATLNASLRKLTAIADRRVRADGLARLAFPGNEPSGLAGAMLRSARLKTATLSDWLAAPPAIRTQREAAARAAVHGLIGLGPGLTPSGDDVIAGMLIALHATGWRDDAEALAGFVGSAPAERTSSLSGAFLAAACSGLPSAAMHTAIAAMLAGDVDALPAAMDRLTGIGHTSGWDMLAGAVLGLRAEAAATLTPRARPAPRS